MPIRALSLAHCFEMKHLKVPAAQGKMRTVSALGQADWTDQAVVLEPEVSQLHLGTGHYC